MLLNNIMKSNYAYITHFKENEEGNQLYIIEEEGHAMVRVYDYNDEPDVIFIDSLSTEEKFRNLGIATELLDICEYVASCQNADQIVLWVKKDSWVHDWYKRRGYIDTADCTIEENCTWMAKQVPKNLEEPKLFNSKKIFNKLKFIFKKLIL